MRVALGTILVVVFSAWISPSPVHGQLGSLIVNITSPAPQTTVSGNTGVSASVTIVGLLTVVGVQFKLDGANLGAEDTQAPYLVNWDTTKTNNGSHTLTAVARDLLGIRYTSNPVVVYVSNDQTPPAVTITFPTAGSTVNQTITVTADASDNVAVAGVRFRVDGVNLGAEDTMPPYFVSWNTNTASNGQHSLTAIARDSAGNTTTSNPVVVSVFNDSTPPAVSITFPTAGSTVNSTVTVTANASDNVGVAGVRFRLDGADLGAEDTTAPYSVSWDTNTASNGQHSLTAIARDSAGNTTTSNPVAVSVFNDPAPPAVSITFPTAGSTVNNTITVTANASDNVGVAGVRFRLDGADLGAEDTTAPYSVSWDTTSASNGQHSLTAVARDSAGNTATSNPVVVSVFNDSTPPAVTITSPAAGSTVNSTITVTADASDNAGVAGVRFRLDGADLAAEDTTAPYSVSWNTTLASNGQHSLTAVARDNAGNTTASAAVSVVVCNPTATPTYIEETDSCISYSAGWTHDTALRPWSGGSAAFTQGAQATFTFVGTSVNWIGFRGPQAGIARVTLDGVFAAEVDTYSLNEAVQSVVFRKTGLAAGTHTLTIEATGGKNPLATDSFVVVDAFDLTPSPIVVENQLPGSPNWQMWLNGYRNAEDLNKQIKGYASATSVNKGQSISFHVTVNPAQTFTMDIYRMGWYQGLGGRFMQRVGPLNGVQQPACPSDPLTGLIECPWTASYTLNVPATWTSGVFLAQLTNAQGFQNYITFVVRDDARRADVLYQQSVTTYQAYNNYPNDGATGKSIYDYNSWGANTITGTPRAAKVSFNRPYNQDGNGQFLLYEYYFVRWLERSGYDVTYSTDLDTHQNGTRLLNHRAFLSVGHDEYWSKAMYAAAEQARDAGIHLAFFEANAVYWQVRFEPSPMSGVADRVMVSYKDQAIDPVQGPTTTVLWRDPLPNRPEQRLIGVQFAADQPVDNPNFPYIVSNSSNWVYAGTGLIDGSQIPGIVGYEIDSFTASAPPPPAVAGTHVILSQSPFVDDRGVAFIANSSIYQATSGAWVFGAGTIGWSWGLDKSGVADLRIQRTTANVLNRFLGLSLP